MSQQPWDASQGANPDTCLHFIARDVDSQGVIFRVCFSCSSTLSEEYCAGFVWDWDEDGGTWKRWSERDSRRIRSGEHHPLLGGS